MKLTLDILKEYKFEEKTYPPDWDDVAIDYSLPNGIVLTTLTVCNNSPCKETPLEGYDGQLYIETKKDLDDILSKSFEEIMEKYKIKNPNMSKYLTVKDLKNLLENIDDNIPLCITNDGKGNQYGIAEGAIQIIKNPYFGNDPDAEKAFYKFDKDGEILNKEQQFLNLGYA